MVCLNACRYFLDNDSKSVIASFIPNVSKSSYVLHPVLQQLEKEPKLRTCFVSPMKDATIKFLPYGECLRVAYPVVKSNSSTYWYCEVYVFKSLEARSTFLMYIDYHRRCRLQQQRRQIFRSKEINGRRYYCILQKFTLNTD